MDESLQKYLLNLAIGNAEEQATAQNARRSKMQQETILREELAEKSKRDDVILDEFEQGNYKTLDQKLRASRIGKQVRGLLNNVVDNLNVSSSGALGESLSAVIDNLGVIQELLKSENIPSEIIQAIQNFTEDTDFIDRTTFTKADITKIKNSFKKTRRYLNNSKISLDELGTKIKKTKNMKQSIKSILSRSTIPDIKSMMTDLGYTGFRTSDKKASLVGQLFENLTRSSDGVISSVLSKYGYDVDDIDIIFDELDKLDNGEEEDEEEYEEEEEEEEEEDL
jgi:hypothetical protein